MRWLLYTVISNVQISKFQISTNIFDMTCHCFSKKALSSVNIDPFEIESLICGCYCYFSFKVVGSPYFYCILHEI